MLIGRESECGRIDELLERARLGRSGSLVVRGEAGMGKTTLLDYAADASEGMTTVRTLGVESEAELEYSALLDLCRPLLGYLGDVAEHQAEALKSALDLGPAVASDTFAVGAGLLGLVAAAAEAKPVLVLVDDAHWLDRPSCDALLFATRRLGADRVVVLIGARDGEGRPFEAPGIASIVVEGLDAKAASLLLHQDADVSSAVADLLYEATGGNPLALVELPALLSTEQLSGRRPLEGPLPAGASVERAYAGRAEGLPADAQTALLVAAATSTRRSDVMLAALAGLGVEAAAIEDGEDAGLLRIVDGRIEFRHPLVRSAVYQGAAMSQRRAVHRALAEACAELEPEEAAWHLATATVGPDEDVAAALADAASRARDRGAHLGASERFERSARLTPDRDVRLHRLTDAAETAWTGGAVERTAALAGEAIAEGEERALSSRLLRLQGRIELQAGTPDRARELFLESAALATEPTSPEAIVTLGLAVFACHYEGRIAASVDIARRIRALAPADGGTTDLQADYVLGRSLMLAGATGEGAPLLERVAAELQRGDDSRTGISRAATSLAILERNAETRPLVERATRIARDEGPMSLLYSLTLSAELDVRQGQWTRAVAAANEGLALARELDQPNIAAHFLVSLAAVHAGRGEEAACRSAAEEALELLARAGMTLVCEQVRCSLGRLELGLDRPEAAIAILEPSAAAVGVMGVHDRDVLPAPDLVEALARLGRIDDARRALDTWVEQGAETGTVAGRALVARCRGLLAAEEYVPLFVEAVAAHGRIGDPFSEARTRLCFGERLRRAGLRIDARRELRAALVLFEVLEAEAWIARGRRELRASGEKLARRDPARRDELTPQELQIALQVAEGKTNKDVAAALYLSPKTVEFHLSRIYRKLDMSSRAELIRRYAADAMFITAAS